jgi:hypothetical protein
MHFISNICDVNLHGVVHPSSAYACNARSVHRSAVEAITQTSLLPVSIARLIFCGGVPTLTCAT